MRYLVVFFFALSLTIGVACNGDTDEDESQDTGLTDADEQSDTEVAPPRLDSDGERCELYDEPGPYSVGLMDTELDDGVPLAIFYPAVDESASQPRADYDMRDFLPEEDQHVISDEDAPLFEMNAALNVDASPEGPFPLVVFSHGLAGYRYQSSTLLAHLASWGFVVASAEHQERNLAHVLDEFAPDGDNAPQVMRETVAFMSARSEDDASPLSGLVDLASIGVAGHSMGGNGTASMVGEPGVDAAIFYASNVDVSDEENVALFWMAGSTDELAPLTQITNSYQSAPAPKSFLALTNAGHLAFSDICEIGADQGGILQIAADSGLDVPSFIVNLGQSGCRDSDLGMEDAWPIIHHYSVAHLRHSLGIDPEPVGLSAATPGCFEDQAELNWRTE